jgi:DNA-binding transcriptional MocR family regulator
MIEPGTVHYGGSSPPTNFFRLGLSCIGRDLIEPGVKMLAEVIAGLRR